MIYLRFVNFSGFGHVKFSVIFGRFDVKTSVEENESVFFFMKNRESAADRSTIHYLLNENK